jgi:hypothetical protein
LPEEGLKWKRVLQAEAAGFYPAGGKSTRKINIIYDKRLQGGFADTGAGGSPAPDILPIKTAARTTMNWKRITESKATRMGFTCLAGLLGALLLDCLRIPIPWLLGPMAARLILSHIFPGKF